MTSNHDIAVGLIDKVLTRRGRGTKHSEAHLSEAELVQVVEAALDLKDTLTARQRLVDAAKHAPSPLD